MLAIASASAVLLAAPPPATAAAPSRAQVLASAYAYGHQRGYHVGIAVLDTRTGRTYSAGYHAGTFASESVVKVMIATRVYLQGRLHGRTAQRMYTMITRSDDQIASSTYGSVGGDHLITYIKKRFHLPKLGSEPRRAGWWGNTHITPDGMVALYAKLKAMPSFGRWLLNAMHHATKHGSDGFYQWFGLKSANSSAAIKQGWGTDYDNWSAGADENTTGFVNGDRYAIAILARGPARTYGSPIGSMLTATAKRLLPGGVFPGDAPVVTSLSRTSGRVAGGARISVHGRNLTGASTVYFGRVRATGLRRLSGTTVSVVSPAHAAGVTRVRVVTPLGTSSTNGPAFTYYGLPTASALSVAEGPPGQQVVVTGTTFVGPAFRVRFGSTWVQATATSSTSMTFTVPDDATTGAATVLPSTVYGTATTGPTFTVDPPAAAAPNQATPSAPVH